MKNKTYEEEISISFKNPIDFTPLIKTARTVKQDEEVECFKKALEITNEGIKEILRNLKPGMHEYLLPSVYFSYLKYLQSVNIN